VIVIDGRVSQKQKPSLCERFGLFYTLFLTQASLVTTAHKKSPIHFVYQASFFCDLSRQEFELFGGFKGNT
jgi:hypothetical protein